MSNNDDDPNAMTATMAGDQTRIFRNAHQLLTSFDAAQLAPGDSILKVGFEQAFPAEGSITDERYQYFLNEMNSQRLGPAVLRLRNPMDGAVKFVIAKIDRIDDFYGANVTPGFNDIGIPELNIINIPREAGNFTLNITNKTFPMGPGDDAEVWAITGAAPLHVLTRNQLKLTVEIVNDLRGQLRELNKRLASRPVVSAAAATAAGDSNDISRKAQVEIERHKKHAADMETQLIQMRQRIQQLETAARNNASNAPAANTCNNCRTNVQARNEVGAQNQTLQHRLELLEHELATARSLTQQQGIIASMQVNGRSVVPLQPAAIRTTVAMQHLFVSDPAQPAGLGMNMLAQMTFLNAFKSEYLPDKSLHPLDVKSMTWPQHNFNAFIAWFNLCLEDGLAASYTPEQWPTTPLCQLGDLLLTTLSCTRHSLTPGAAAYAHTYARASPAVADDPGNGFLVNSSLELQLKRHSLNHAKKEETKNKKNNNKPGAKRGGGGGGGTGNATAGHARQLQ